MPELTITNFSPGLNTLADERQLMPNQKGEPAESPFMENVEITSEGAIATSTGFELVSSINSTGGTENLMTYEKNSTTRFMIIAHGNHYYSVNPASFTWNDLGSYGTAATNVGGAVFLGSSTIRRAILGNDNNADNTKVWDGTTFADLGGSPPKGWIMEVLGARIFLAQANSAVLFFSGIRDETNWAVSGPADGGFLTMDDIITGLAVQEQTLIVFTKKLAYSVTFTVDSSTGSPIQVPNVEPFKKSSGCLAHKTIQQVYNDNYYFSTDGVQRFGSDPQFISNNLRVNSLSWKINPSITGDAYNSSVISKACGFYFKKKYYMALPYGHDDFNSKTFVYNYDYDSWSSRSGIYPSNFAVMANSDGTEELYFASALAPELYKFTNDYDYNKAGYNRTYRTKRFNFGAGTRNKVFNWIDIQGAMYINTIFYVDIEVDGILKTYKIDVNNLEPIGGGSGYYGDNYYGSQYLGGPNISQFKRFGARMKFPYDTHYGREMQITFRNQEPGQPWKIDYLNISWDWSDPLMIPTFYENTNLI